MSIGRNFLITDWDKVLDVIDIKDYDYYIFDIDGTLYPYEHCHLKALKLCLSQFSINEGLHILETESLYEEAKKIVKFRLGKTAMSHSRFLYFLEMLIDSTGYNVESAQKYEEIYWKNFIPLMDTFSGVKEFLKLIENRQSHISILSDMTIDIQLRKLNHLGIKSYFKYIVTSDIVGAEKPSIMGYDYLGKIMKLNKPRTLMIGDNRSRDYLGAHNFNIDYGHVQIE